MAGLAGLAEFVSRKTNRIEILAVYGTTTIISLSSGKGLDGSSILVQLAFH
jgi:hypothetical protein